jgi:hypothetical protein
MPSPAVPFDLLDKPRNLRFSINALADLEQHLGIGPAQIFEEGRVGFLTIRGLLWAGLRWEDKRLTPERVGDLIETFIEKGGSLEGLMEPVSRALNSSGVIRVQQADSEESDVIPPKGETQT